MIIGVVGFIGSGKDTIADYLVNIHQFRRDSFAATLKDAVSAVFGWDRDLLEGRSKQARQWREQVDSWWSQRLNMPHLTPRFILQHWGTDVCRINFHDDIWIASLENKLRHSADNVVISDCRFPNEIAAIRRAGGIVIRVRRGGEPEWYDLAARANRGDLEASAALANIGIHVSETAWIGTVFDCVIENNSTLDNLYQRINDLVQDLPEAMADQV